jgi:hypothetical protein
MVEASALHDIERKRIVSIDRTLAHSVFGIQH